MGPENHGGSEVDEQKNSFKISNWERNKETQTEELTEREIQEIANSFGITVEEAKDKIKAGLESLVSRLVLFGETDPFIRPQEARNVEDYPYQETTEFGRIVLENSTVLDFSIYAKGKPFYKKDQKMCLNIRKQGNEACITEYFYETGQVKDFGYEKIPFYFDHQPFLNTDFSYAIYNQEGSLISIFPLRFNSELDEKAVSQSKAIQEIYLRNIEKSEVSSAMKYAREIGTQIETVDDKLLIADENIPVNLILVGGKHFIARHVREAGEITSNLIFSLRRIEMSETEAARGTFFRHEYAHAIDGYFGDENKTLSESLEREIVAVLNRNLFGDRLQETVFEDHWYELKEYEDRHRFGSIFTEQFFFEKLYEDEGMSGHPREGVEEFFASFITIYTDPKFEEALVANFEPEEAVRVQKTYQEIFNLINSEIKKSKLKI